MNPIHCLVVDDEPLARKGMQEYIAEMETLSLTGLCRSADEAATVMKQHPVDLIFLDIEMPGLSGLQFLKSLKDPPAVILTTAYPEYAVEGFELDVIDYLLKPVPFLRFARAVQKASDFLASTRAVSLREVAMRDHFFLKVNSRFEKVRYDDVLFIEALQNYVSVHLGDRKLLSYMPISALEKQLPENLFLRVHKSYLVSLRHITALQKNTLVVAKRELPVSRKIKEKLQRVVLANSLLKRP